MPLARTPAPARVNDGMKKSPTCGDRLLGLKSIILYPNRRMQLPADKYQASLHDKNVVFIVSAIGHRADKAAA